jgi:plasmid stabilization system protein ParE
VTEVRWTAQAADDLQAIHDFIARDSPRYARAEVERILAAIDQLEELPDCGRVVSEYQRDEIREVIERPYRLVYRRQPDAVIMLMIFRASRSTPTLPGS